MISTENPQGVFQKICRILTTPCIVDLFVVGGLFTMFLYQTMGIIYACCPELLNTAKDYYTIVSDLSFLCLLSILITAWYYHEKSLAKKYISEVKTWKEFYKKHNDEVED